MDHPVSDYVPGLVIERRISERREAVIHIRDNCRTAVLQRAVKVEDKELYARSIA